MSENISFICKRFSCHKIYEINQFALENNNQILKQNICVYHSGVFEPGTKYWKENWTCCGKQWDAEGCCKGVHDGANLDAYEFLCINRGNNLYKLTYK